jgi:iron only hydrogenase large subunit-like protein/nitrogen-specific signal transduction histidine kinase
MENAHRNGKNSVEQQALVYTIKNRCRVCYTCVRECPVKAIRMTNGQAEIVQERCIVCGNCVKVCSQGAKAYADHVSFVQQLLESPEQTIALVAPSFVAEFTEFVSPEHFVGMLKQAGFNIVTEVAFGADIIASKYKALLESGEMEKIISSDCPAIVNYIKKYHPNLVPYLAPIDSPLMAMAKVVKAKYGATAKTVFIGPCIAKKEESDDLDYVLTFSELRQLFSKLKLKAEAVSPALFDPPIGGKGAILPVSHGLLHNMNLSDDIAENETVVAQGRHHFIDVLEAFEKGMIDAKYLELLACEGCIMGPGTSKHGNRFLRRNILSKATKQKLKQLDQTAWKMAFDDYSGIDTYRRFEPEQIDTNWVEEEAIETVLKSMNKILVEDLLNCGACGYETCREHAKAIVNGLAEKEMCLPYTIDNLNASNEALANAKQALKQSEKMASMGQLSAGIAHELNNPLGVITMYSHILKDEVDPTDPIQEDLSLIVEQAERCKTIVGGLLNFARKTRLKKEQVDFEAFVKGSFKSIIRNDNINLQFKSQLRSKITIDIDKEQMLQALTNLEKNAVEAMPDGGVLSIELSETTRQVVLEISDTGCGISPQNMEKIFTPFFTTKPIGKGTGLGLPHIYGIVKMHSGQIQVKSNTDTRKGATGTTFTIKLNKNI